VPGEERHEGSDDGGEQVRRAGEIAQPSGEVFTERGWDAVVVPPEQVQGIDSFDAVVLGSAVYAGHWLKPARELVDRSREALAARPVWLFSSGPSQAGRGPGGHRRHHAGHQGSWAPGVRRQAGEEAAQLPRSGHGGGAAGPEGDFRDWKEIKAWAAEIADAQRPRS
jgi:menaquinone-dependent protoporphyrinogen oxidase